MIICTLNGETRLPQCLASVFEQTFKDFEILVIDDGSRDGTPALLETLKETSPVPLRCLRQEGLGPAAGRNLGVRSATGSLVVFTDDDVTVEPGWLEALIRRFDRHPEAAGVEGMSIARQHPEGLYRLNLENRTGGLYLTCNMAYRREAFEEVEGFDERFFYPCREDSDLAFRVLDGGKKIIFEPEARAYHTYYKTSIWLPLRIAGTLSHSVYIHRKHPKRFPLGSLFYPSYLLVLASVVAALVAWALGHPVAALALVVLYAAVVVRNLVRDVRWQGIHGLRTLGGLLLSYTLLPLVYLYHLTRSLLRHALGKNPIPERKQRPRS